MEPVYESWNRLHSLRRTALGYGVAVPEPIPLSEMETAARLYAAAEERLDWIDYLRVLEDVYLAHVRGKLVGDGPAQPP